MAKSQDYRSDLDAILNIGWWAGAVIFVGAGILSWFGVLETSLTYAAVGIACLAMATKEPKR